MDLGAATMVRVPRSVNEDKKETPRREATVGAIRGDDETKERKNYISKI
jgi:hypothetical protein